MATRVMRVIAAIIATAAITATITAVRLAIVVVVRITMVVVMTAIAGRRVVVAIVGSALRVIDLDVRSTIVVRADDPMTAHRQRNRYDAADPQQ
ncbi:MAG: hypothetical protein ACJA0V_000448 [Planctomycetota bacterium]